MNLRERKQPQKEFGCRSTQACVVSLVVQRSGTDVREVPHGKPINAKDGICSELLETETAEGHIAKPDLVLSGLEVHHELLGGGSISRLTDQPELIGPSTAIEVVAASRVEYVNAKVSPVPCLANCTPLNPWTGWPLKGVLLPLVGFKSAAPESCPAANVSAAILAKPVRMALGMAVAFGRVAFMVVGISSVL